MAIIAVLISLFPKKLPKAVEREKRAATAAAILNQGKELNGSKLPSAASGLDTVSDDAELIAKHGFKGYTICKCK